MESKDRDPLSPLGPNVFAALRRERLGAGLAAHLTDQGYRAVHDPATGAVRATDPLGHTTRYEPDHQGFVGVVESPLGRRWQLDNDPKGRLTGLTDPAGTRLAIAYDERGRPARLARQGGPNFRLAYDGADNLTEAHWPDGTRETFDYRDYRLLTACTDRAGARQGYDYDAAGRLRAATDANGAVTRFLYGTWDRPDATLYPDGRREDYTWQPSPTDPGQAQLAALGDAAGPYARLRYADGRLAAIAWRDGEQVSFRHDAAGRVLEAGVGDRLVRFTYDAAGRVLTEETDGARILYRYDPAGNLIGIEGPTGAVGYAWNADLELAAIRAWDGRTAELTYSPDGRTCETRLSERLTSRTVRTGGGRLGEIEVLAAGQRISAARYAYDGEDRLSGVAQTDAPTLRYSYDAAGRLATVTRADGTTANFAYDPAGYRLRADQTQASYDAVGKVLASGSDRLVYDARGRVSERTAGGVRWEYRWSDRGLLTAAQSSAGLRVDYDYDAFARRTGKRVTDAQGQVTQTHFLWAGEQLIAELRQGPTGISRRDYLWYPGSHRLFALRIDGAIYYAHNDHLGVTRRLTDPWGGTVWAAEFDPWGAAQLAVGHVEQPWRLPGQYQDAETGLHYNRFRYYVPGLGRYLSPDPLGLLAGFDLYAYADNDPINGADPLGLWTWAGVAKVTGAVIADSVVGAALLVLAPSAVTLGLIAVGVAAVAVGLDLNAALDQTRFRLPCIVVKARNVIADAVESFLLSLNSPVAPPLDVLKSDATKASEKTLPQGWLNTVDRSKADPRWDAYDAEIKAALDEFQAHLSALSPDYVSPDWRIIKAMVWTETGGPDNAAWKARVMQIGNPGDPGLDDLKKRGSLILPRGLLEKINAGVDDPAVNIRAGIGYMLFRSVNVETKSIVNKNDSAFYEYTVKSGDNLSKIAPNLGTTVENLKDSNQGAATMLKPGQQLRYQKASMQQIIESWEAITTERAAEMYNVGDPDYQAKLDYCLTLIGK